MSTAAASRRAGAPPERSPEWRERASRLYPQLRRPARAMVRRAYRGAFSDDEIDDISVRVSESRLSMRFLDFLRQQCASKCASLGRFCGSRPLCLPLALSI
jgi:hypothetical protein